MSESLDLDERRIRAMIKQAELRSRVFKKTFTYEADWLVSGGIGDAEWVVQFPNSLEPDIYSFSRLLPDGTNLTDSLNRNVLESIQKWLFHCRMGTISGRASSPARWIECYRFAINISSWLILHKAVYNPEKYGFMLIDIDACKSLADDLCAGSWIKALHLKERVIRFLSSHLPGDLYSIDLTNNPDNLPKPFVDASIEFLTSQDAYVKSVLHSTYNKAGVSRDFIGTVLGIPPASLRHISFRIFLRQFEPRLADGILFQPIIRTNNFMSQNTKSVEDLTDMKAGTKNFQASMVMLSYFFKAHKFLPQEIPDVKFCTKEFMSEFSGSLKPKGHTKLLPLEIGFHTLNQAIRWILVYGEPIVDSIIHYVEKFEEINKKNADSKQPGKRRKYFNSTRDTWITNAFEGLPAQPLVEALNITSLHIREKRTPLVGESTYQMVIESFMGACGIIVGMLKPIRSTELSNLGRDCLSYDKESGGAFLRHSAGKTGVIGINTEIERPIPYIAAHAIQLMQVLGNSLVKLYDDNSEHSNHLFYFPGKSFKRPRAKRNELQLNMAINRFCDFIDIPVDDKGRRWYVRVHEMRKFFLILAHRHEGDGSKDLLRHLAGHSNDKHLDDYIAYEASDSEAIRYESECIDDKLIALEMGLIPKAQNEGLVALYTQILREFGATSISTINKKDFLKYLDKTNMQAEFDITTYTVPLEDYDNKTHAIDFAIKLGRHTDAKYYKQ